MRISVISVLPAVSLIILGFLPSQILADDILKADGYSLCSQNSDIQVQKFDISYDRASQQVTFDVAGTSNTVQNVTASLIVTAYGNQVYQNTFDPCAAGTKVDQLCPVPSGTFAAQGTQAIPSTYANQIPSIAFSVPDLDGQAKLLLNSKNGQEVACIQSDVSNGKSLQLPAVSYVVAGVACAALLFSGLSALVTAGHPGGASSSPSFGEVMGWFHSVATSGMLSVEYPAVYRSFASNFAFSTGLFQWAQLQQAIDDFRLKTGGNLTADSYEYLSNSTVASSNSSSSSKRSIDLFLERSLLASRDISVTNSTGNTTAANSNNSNSTSGVQSFVHGIQTYAAQLMIPQSNTFMTVLLIFSIVIAAIAVGILLFKLILELWALYGTFPKKLSSFRKNYWGLLSRTITNLILILYGIWTLYCVFQFTRGDSWAAKILAGITLAIFTSVLVFFTFRIWQLARRYKKAQGDASMLYEDKETWRKYSLFYDAYKREYWWLFVPLIVYMFARGCIIAGGDGHGLIQTGGQLIVESLMLILLLWSRPYVTKSGQWINLAIQLVRVLSVACILVFVQELGVSQTTKTIFGVVLIAVQSTLTGILAILIAVNGLIVCIRENPHRKRRKQAADKMNRDFDNLTPLDARNSLLMEHPPLPRGSVQDMSRFNQTGPYEPYRHRSIPRRNESMDLLIRSDSPSNYHNRFPSRDSSPSPEDPHLPVPHPHPYGVAY
ncbi:Transient receptor potential (TRP) ion channel domain containing protein [Elaphomyces granulatus]